MRSLDFSWSPSLLPPQQMQARAAFDACGALAQGSLLGLPSIPLPLGHLILTMSKPAPSTPHSSPDPVPAQWPPQTAVPGWKSSIIFPTFLHQPSVLLPEHLFTRVPAPPLPPACSKSPLPPAGGKPPPGWVPRLHPFLPRIHFPHSIRHLFQTSSRSHTPFSPIH